MWSQTTRHRATGAYVPSSACRTYGMTKLFRAKLKSIIRHDIHKYSLFPKICSPEDVRKNVRNVRLRNFRAYKSAKVFISAGWHTTNAEAFVLGIGEANAEVRVYTRSDRLRRL